MKKLLFKNNITKINIHYKLEYDDYMLVHDHKLCVGYKYFIIPVYKKVSAIVRTWNRNFICLPENLKNRSNKIYLEEETVYYYPHIDIFNGKGYETIYFDTTDELDSFLEENKIFNIPHIKIE